MGTTDLRFLREKYLEGEPVEGIRPVVREAWERCLSYGVRPDAIATQTFDPVRFAKARLACEQMVASAEPYLQDIHGFFGERPHMIAVVDPQAVVLRLLTNERLAKHAPNIFEGASWSERDVGCNGAGTAVATGQSVILIGAEHFCEPYLEWTCVGVPIRGRDGVLLGALDFSLPSESADPNAWGWVLSTAKAIERDLHESACAKSSCVERVGADSKNPLVALNSILELLGTQMSKVGDHHAVFSEALQKVDEAKALLTEYEAQAAGSTGRLQKALVEARQQNSELEALFDGISDPIFVIERDRVVKCNRAMKDFIESHGRVREPVSDVMAVFFDSEVKMIDKDGRVLPFLEWPPYRAMNGQRVNNIECSVLTPDGVITEMLVSATPIRTEKGKPARTLTFSRDVTEMRRLERAKDQFIQVIAHELRNPLSAVKGLSELIKLKIDPESWSTIGRYLDLIGDQIDRLGTLVNEIINAYRVSSGRLPLDLQSVNLAATILNVTQVYQDNATGHRVVTRFEGKADIFVDADPRRLSEVFENLLGNAFKYSSPGSTVFIILQEEPESVLVRVEDEGIGIPPGQLERVFEGFFRSDNLKGRDPGGLGLGLYICRDIVRRHNGELWAENRPERGTAMCIRLPKAVPGHAEALAGNS